MALKENKEAQDYNEDASEKYRKASEEVNKVLQGVWEDWYRCRELKVKHQKVASTYEEYRRLTDDDQELAVTFLLKAFTHEEITEARGWLGVQIPLEFPAKASA